MSHVDEVPAEQGGAPGKPDFMVWPAIPDVHTPPPDEPDRQRRHRRRIALRVLQVSLVLALVLGVAGVGAAYFYEHRLDENIGRMGNPFTPLPEKSRPRAAPEGAMNVLLLGSDSRISLDAKDWVRGAQRTDAIMLAHIPAGRDAVTVTSIPRNSWVTVPGHGKRMLSEGFGLGGPTLMIETVEKLTGVRVDHVVIVDFEGFKNVTNDLGGVKINVPRSTNGQSSDFAAGPQTMDGQTALKYVRQRENQPGGDLYRVSRQQNWIRAVALKTLDKGTLTSPLTLNSVLGSLTSSIAADDGFSIGRMRALAFSLRDIRSDDLTFLTAPVDGTGRSPDGKQSIVQLDATANGELWKAVAADDMEAWLTTHPDVGRGVPSGELKVEPAQQ